MPYANVSPIEVVAQITIRKASSHVRLVFDPFGLLSRVIVEGRAMIQEMFKLKLDMDDSLPEKRDFIEWVNLLQEVNKIKFYRCLIENENSQYCFLMRRKKLDAR
jgi:hypothetical protein